jgi:hypothetical protein
VRFLRERNLLEVLWQKTKQADEVSLELPNTSGVVVHRELNDLAAKYDHDLDGQHNASQEQIVAEYQHVCTALGTRGLTPSNLLCIVNCKRKEQEYVPWSNEAASRKVKADQHSVHSLGNRTSSRMAGLCKHEHCFRDRDGELQ